MKKPQTLVIVHDEVAKILAPLFLPPEGSEVPAEELREAVAKLAAATREMKALARARTRES